ncbi:m7GpppX diphosphatase isoform X2 [Galendromus occidentalis]|uniref:m7GpppX diphosphatase n=1 Tax=Galendromus occidentalis TaxID=34638 RepID=A0AAJ6QMI4_9ACAR|nr:m7GpppX diphosphatase isoform X2 [Galendromus occidentalis]
MHSSIRGDSLKSFTIPIFPREIPKKMSDEIREAVPCDFTKFRFKRILNDDAHAKVVYIEGLFEGDDPAVVILEKVPFEEQQCAEILTESGAGSHAETFRNDIYSGYRIQPEKKLNEIKATVIYPATPKHIEKYSRQEFHYVRETADIYREKVAPFLEKNSFSLQWVYNVLDRKKEEENILFEDKDEKLGFMLCKDMKWDMKSNADLHALVIAHDRTLHSIRDLRREHIPLLENIREKSITLIEEKFGLGEDKLLMYFHYPPSYYQLHVHIVALTFENPPGGGCQRGHLLDTVKSNLEICSDFYDRATLSYTVRHSDPLRDVFFPEKTDDEKSIIDPTRQC